MKPHRIAQLTAVGVAAAAVAVPVGQAATNDRVQVAGSLVAPADVSQAQLEAGQAASTRMVQIGGALVAPSQVSAYQSRSASTVGTGADSSSGIGTGSIAAIAVLGAFAALFVGSAIVLRRHRQSPAPAS